MPDPISADHPTNVRRVYRGPEHGTIEIPIHRLVREGTLDVYPWVTGKDYFDIQLNKDRLSLKARGFVGLIPINDAIAIDVYPRVPVNNLAHLIEIAGTSPCPLWEYLRAYPTAGRRPPSMVDLFARALVNALGHLAGKGRRHEYVPLTTASSFPRGRVRLGETLARHLARGKRHIVIISRFDLSYDTGPNRCIKYAIWFLAQKYLSTPPRGRTRILSDLNRVYHLFEGVELDRSRGFMQHDWVRNPGALPPGSDHYRDSLQLAKLVIREEGVAFLYSGSDVTLATLLVKIDDIFEAYLRNILSDRMLEVDPSIEVLDGNKKQPKGGQQPLFSFGESLSASPDIILRKIHEGPSSAPENKRLRGVLLLIEVKYKPGWPDRSDLNQAITYAVAYECPRVVIATPCPSGAAPGIQEMGKVGPVTLYLYQFDLSAGSLTSEERDFTNSVYGLAASRRPSNGNTAERQPMNQ